MQKVLDFIFKNQSPRQTIFKNTLWLTIASVGGRAIRSLLVIYAARLLGAAGFGIFSYALGFAALLIGLSDVGINSILNRDLAKEEGQKQQIIATSFFIKIALSVAAYATLIIASFLIVTIPDARPIIPLIALALLLDGFREFGFAVTRAFQEMEIEAGITIAYQAAAVLFGFIILWIWPTVTALAFTYVLGSLIGASLILGYLKNYFRNLKMYFNRSLVKSILRDAFPFAIGSFGGFLLLYTDTLFLGWLKTDIDVGYYNAALKILQILNLIPSLFIIALFPTITQRVLSKEARSIIEKAVVVMILISLPIAIGGFLLSNAVVTVVFGNQYLAAAPIFQVLILLTVPGFLMAVLGYVLLAHNKQMATVKYVLGAAVVNLFLNYFFIRWLGTVGSALATLISQSIIIIGVGIEVKKLETLHIAPRIWRIILATAGMALGIVLMKTVFLSSFIIFPAAILIYFSLLALSREPLLKEIRLG